MDYWQYLQYKEYPDIDNYMDKLVIDNAYLCSTKAEQRYSDIKFKEHCILLFGNESSGAPPHVQKYMQEQNRLIRIPMLKEHRSINIAVSTGIVLYEVLRQQSYQKLV